LEPDAKLLAIGRIQAVSGAVFVTRATGAVAAVNAHDPVYRGDVIETAADGAVRITFSDGTEFRLSADASIVLDEFVCTPEGRSHSGLFRVVRGTFAFIAGKLLTNTGSLRIDTPLGSIRAGARGSGLGTLTLTALTLAAIEEVQAGPPPPSHDTWQDDDAIEVASRYDVTTKDGHTYQVVPGQLLVIDARGSASTTPISLTQNEDLSFRTLGILSQGQAALQQMQLQGQRADTTTATGGGEGSASVPLPLGLTGGTQLAALAGPTAGSQTPAISNNPGTPTTTTTHPGDFIPPTTPTTPTPQPATPAAIAIGGITISGPNPNPADITVAAENIVNASVAHAGFTITGTESGGSGPVTVQILNSQGNAVFTSQPQVGGGFSVNLTPTQVTQTLPDGSYTLTATVNNAAGNPVTASLPLTVATTLPTVTINPVDADGDNVVNHVDAQNGVGLSGSVHGLAPNSMFSITVTDGSFKHSYPATVNAAGTGWTATIPNTDATTLPNGTLTVTAQVTDQFANQSVPASQAFTVAQVLPVATLSVNDTSDHIINNAESTAVAFTVGGLDDTGSGTVIFTDGGNIVTVHVTGNGAYSASLHSLNDGQITSSLSFTDAVGNTVSATGNAVALDTDKTEVATLSVNDTSDHIINNAESTAVAFTVGGLDDTGSGTVTFTDGSNNSVTVHVTGDGTYSASLHSLNDGQITSSLSFTDAEGNTASATGNAVAPAFDAAKLGGR
jgi:hypothetical protein